MSGTITRQCSFCLTIFMPEQSPQCPGCAGQVPRKLRDQKPPIAPDQHATYLQIAATQFSVLAFRTARSAACEASGCPHHPQLVTIRAALAKCPLPCRRARDCYGYMEVVFAEELNAYQLVQISPDL